MDLIIARMQKKDHLACLTHPEPDQGAQTLKHGPGQLDPLSSEVHQSPKKINLSYIEIFAKAIIIGPSTTIRVVVATKTVFCDVPAAARFMNQLIGIAVTTDDLRVLVLIVATIATIGGRGSRRLHRHPPRDMMGVEIGNHWLNWTGNLLCSMSLFGYISLEVFSSVHLSNVRRGTCGWAGGRSGPNDYCLMTGRSTFTNNTSIKFLLEWEHSVA